MTLLMHPLLGRVHENPKSEVGNGFRGSVADSAVALVVRHSDSQAVEVVCKQPSLEHTVIRDWQLLRYISSNTLNDELRVPVRWYNIVAHRPSSS